MNRKKPRTLPKTTISRVKTKTKAKQVTQQLKPLIQIGKQGIQIEHIKNQLKLNRLLKIKVLESALKTDNRKTEIKEIAKRIAKSTNSEVIRVVGNVITLKK